MSSLLTDKDLAINKNIEIMQVRGDAASRLFKYREALEFDELIDKPRSRRMPVLDENDH